MVGATYSPRGNQVARLKESVFGEPHTHTHICTYSHMLTPTHAQTHACTHSHVHTLTHAHTHTCTHSHMHPLTHACTLTCTHAPTHTCTHARTLTHAHTKLTLSFIHTIHIIYFLITEEKKMLLLEIGVLYLEISVLYFDSRCLDLVTNNHTNMLEALKIYVRHIKYHVQLVPLLCCSWCFWD